MKTKNEIIQEYDLIKKEINDDIHNQEQQIEDIDNEKKSEQIANTPWWIIRDPMATQLYFYNAETQTTKWTLPPTITRNHYHEIQRIINFLINSKTKPYTIPFLNQNPNNNNNNNINQSPNSNKINKNSFVEQQTDTLLSKIPYLISNTEKNEESIAKSIAEHSELKIFENDKNRLINTKQCSPNTNRSNLNNIVMPSETKNPLGFKMEKNQSLMGMAIENNENLSQSLRGKSKRSRQIGNFDWWEIDDPNSDFLYFFNAVESKTYWDLPRVVEKVYSSMDPVSSGKKLKPNSVPNGKRPQYYEYQKKLLQQHLLQKQLKNSKNLQSFNNNAQQNLNNFQNCDFNTKSPIFINKSPNLDISNIENNVLISNISGNNNNENKIIENQKMETMSMEPSYGGNFYETKVSEGSGNNNNGKSQNIKSSPYSNLKVSKQIGNSNWFEIHDGNCDTIYYFNGRTKKTQWEKPEIALESPSFSNLSPNNVKSDQNANSNNKNDLKSKNKIVSNLNSVGTRTRSRTRSSHTDLDNKSLIDANLARNSGLLTNYLHNKLNNLQRSKIASQEVFSDSNFSPNLNNLSPNLMNNNNLNFNSNTNFNSSNNNLNALKYYRALKKIKARQNLPQTPTSFGRNPIGLSGQINDLEATDNRLSMANYIKNLQNIQNLNNFRKIAGIKSSQTAQSLQNLHHFKKIQKKLTTPTSTPHNSNLNTASGCNSEKFRNVSSFNSIPKGFVNADSSPLILDQTLNSATKRLFSQLKSNNLVKNTFGKEKLGHCGVQKKDEDTCVPNCPIKRKLSLLCHMYHQKEQERKICRNKAQRLLHELYQIKREGNIRGALESEEVPSDVMLSKQVPQNVKEIINNIFLKISVAERGEILEALSTSDLRQLLRIKVIQSGEGALKDIFRYLYAKDDKKGNIIDKDYADKITHPTHSMRPKQKLKLATSNVRKPMFDSNLPYVCYICCERFLRERELEFHGRTTHFSSSVTKKKCEECKNVFVGDFLFIAHKKVCDGFRKRESEEDCNKGDGSVLLEKKKKVGDVAVKDKLKKEENKEKDFCSDVKIEKVAERSEKKEIRGNNLEVEENK